MENDAFRMQNGGPKVAISGAPIDAQGCGLSSVLSTQLFPAGVTPRETILWHLLPSVANGWADWLSRRHGERGGEEWKMMRLECRMEGQRLR